MEIEGEDETYDKRVAYYKQCLDEKRIQQSRNSSASTRDEERKSWILAAL